MRGLFYTFTTCLLLSSCGETTDVFSLDVKTGEVRHNGKILSIEDQMLVFDDPAYDDAEVRVTDGSTTEVYSGKQFREQMREDATAMLDEAFKSERPDITDPQPSVPLGDPFAPDKKAQSGPRD
jgi:hypothetical protein